MSSVITTFSTKRAAAGATSVTCTKRDGSLSVSWAVKCYSTNIKEATVEAEKYAAKALWQMKLGLPKGGSDVESASN
jgi:hypothetical protein